MKIKKELITIMDKRGYFIGGYSNNESVLAFSAGLVEDVSLALTIPVEYYEEEKEKYEHMAKMFGGQLVKIEAEYEVRTIDGEEPETTKETEDELNQAFGKAFAKFMASKLGGLD
ncbi:hypothetical protein [Streptococcus sp. NLN64]|uniref:hypothetical protein n=1 Tax=Streptococcus sp. NLN64 TaxID=2822799 RepID=UPI0018C91DAD|nr:hypothetical protein [Streptococcus sp. NLN64]MBG9366521.1 hypothetical protein [Streptococcus sp. NLN64]